MKAVILAAGYGTRLQRDVAADTSGRFARLLGTAKPLLPVGQRALISHWVSSLTVSGCVDCIYVVVSCNSHILGHNGKMASNEPALRLYNVLLCGQQKGLVKLAANVC